MNNSKLQKSEFDFFLNVGKIFFKPANPNNNISSFFLFTTEVFGNVLKLGQLLVKLIVSLDFYQCKG